MLTDFRLVLTDFRLVLTDFGLVLTDFGLVLTDFKLVLTDFKLMLTDFGLVLIDSKPAVNGLEILHRFSNGNRAEDGAVAYSALKGHALMV